MNAMARKPSGEALDETLDHPSDSAPSSDGPAGAHAMPETTPQGQNRYVFTSGARPLEGYTIKRAIGRGGFGEVYYATSDAGKEVALKLLTRNIDVERRGVVQCMNLKSPNLITIYDLKTSEAGDTFVIMEYVSGPSLASVLAQHPGGLPMADVRTWMKGLVEGVAYLHDHGIVHRDLKPANMFMEQGVVKIGDYGLSKLITQSQGSGHSESIGTCHYMAPEISTGKYHKPIDVYAIGIILYEMLTGRVPFEGETVGEVLMKHLTARPDLRALPEPYRTIVGKALAKDPAQRPTRVYDLLGPEDAPKQPNVRFIGDKAADATAATPTPDAPAGGKREEEVLRIGAEEPVFYIGPDTRPPARRVPYGEWLRGYRRRLVSNPARRTPVWQPRPVADRRAAAAAAGPPVPPAPPAPPPPVQEPPMPSARVRVAELATSMLWAAPLAALFAFPASGLLGIDVSSQPEQLAYLFGLTLLGTWGLLIPNKLWERKAVDSTTKRIVYLAVGLVLGVTGLALERFTNLALRPAWPEMPQVDLVGYLGPLGRPNYLGEITYFGLLFAANGWWKLTDRDRRSRFRILPVFKAGLIALVLGELWPFPQPWGLTVAALVAIVSQVVSPWSEAAAAYARAKPKTKTV